MTPSTDSDGSDRAQHAPSAGAPARDERWSDGVTRAIGVQLRYWRQRRKLTVQMLSDATAALGQRVPANVLTNLEHSRRDYVSVAELLLVAAALNVPPILLVAPLGREEAVPALPGEDISPWHARGWLMGVRPPIYAGFNLELWNDATTVIKLYDTHRLLVRAYQEAAHRLKELDDDRMDIYPGRQWPEGHLDQRRRFRAVLIRQLASYLDQLRTHRRAIVEMGFMPPALAADVEADLNSPHRTGGSSLEQG